MCGPTSDHEVIVAWAKKHEAVPAEVTPRKFDSEPAILHFLFGKAKTGLPEIVPISWESFFAQFDLMGLVMVFDDTPTFEILHDDRPSIYRPSSSVR